MKSLPEHSSPYEQVRHVIGYIVDHKLQSKSLEEVAAHAGLSSGYLQKLFTEWVGITPKQFGRYLSLQHSKGLLLESKGMLGAAYGSGLSSSGRLHDLYIDIEAMTPGEYQQGGRGLEISYSISETLFGLCLVASTSKGICCILFADSEAEAVRDLGTRFPEARIASKHESVHDEVLSYFKKLSSAKNVGGSSTAAMAKIKFHLKGTNFQIKVWEALLAIPTGSASTYGDIAHALGDKNLSRAVGTAIGQNPIGYIIPCHRVLKSTGEVGGYHWSPERKRAMLGFEAARRNAPPGAE